MKPRTALRCSATLAFLAALAIVFVEAGPNEEPESDGPDPVVLDNVEGTVVQVGNFGFGLVPDADPGTRYAPTVPLDEEFQHDGLRVRFSGIVGDPDDTGRGGRRWGTPLEVTAIERIDADEVP